MHYSATVGVNTVEIAPAVARVEDVSYRLVVTDGDPDTTVYIAFGDGPAVLGQGIRLNGGGSSYEMSRENANYDNRAIHAIATAPINVLITEYGQGVG